MSEWMPNAVERLQGRAAWTAYYESDADKVNRLILENAALQQAIRDQDANEHCIRELKAENAALRESLKQARKFASDNHYTMREFAAIIGITAAQLSAWTDEIPNREPDFKG